MLSSAFRYWGGGGEQDALLGKPGGVRDFINQNVT